jgi:MinD superfamily P-loop ATPase
MKKEPQVFMLTDGCMWEMNKVNGTSHPHAIEVVDVKTGEVRYIKSGSRITFVEGEITEGRNQEKYNKL